MSGENWVLHQAAKDGKLTSLKHMLKQGPNKHNATDNEGMTALMWAAFYDRRDCLEHLIAINAHVNAQDKNKRTALHHAAFNGHAFCVGRLLKAGADTSLKDEHGGTALDHAKKKTPITRTHTDVIKLLDPAMARTDAAARLPEYLRLGVTLPGMRELLKQLPPDAVEQVNAKIPRDDKTGELKFPKNETFNGYCNQYWITKWAKDAKVGQPDGDGLAVCERLRKQGSPHVGKATHFVSWFLATPIETLLDALANFIKQKGLREEDTYLWVCDYVIRQTDVKTDLARLGECVSAVGHTVLLMEPWYAPAPLTRAYCIKEVYHTQESRAEFNMVMSTKEQEAFETALSARNGFEPIKAGLSKVDVRLAKCRNAEDKEQILRELEQGVGGVDECNRNVIDLMRKELVTVAKAAQAAAAKRQLDNLNDLLNELSAGKVSDA